MSLAVLADHMASKGRDGDSMLVHMTPGEVHGLQALAMKHGGSLTINPDTGLPEANFLKSLLPILAGFALGPAGFGLVSSAMGAGAIVGGITGIATGSLSKGLMAGLGAYGGFGIGESLVGAGADAMTRTALSAEGALPSVENIAQVTGEGYGGSAANYSDQVNTAVKAARDTSAAMPTSDLMSAGAKSAMADPLGFAKQNWKPIAAAALPILSDIGTTTPSQAPTMAPGRIREKRWDGRQFVDVASTDAGVYNTSGRNFSDLYRGYNNGGIVALADGGDVKHFAIGDVVKADIDKAYAAGDYGKVNELAQANKITAEDVASTYKGFDTSGLAGLGINLFTPPAGGGGAPVTDTSGGLTALNTAATNTAATNTAATNTDTGGGLAALNTAATTPYYFQVNPDVASEYARNPMGLTPEQFAQAHYTNFGKKEGREFAPSAAVNYATANKTDIVANTLKWIDTNPLATPDQINAAIKGSGMSTGDVNRALDSLVASGKITQSERFYIQQGKGLSAMADSTAKWLKEHPDATQTQIDAVLKTANMDTTDAQRVLSHGFQVANNQMTAASKYIQDNPDVARWITSDQGKAYIKEHPEFDAKDIAFTHYKRYGEKEGRKWGADTDGKTTGTGTGTTTTVNIPTDIATAASTALPVGVSGAGVTTINPNGTVTTRPDLSLGMKTVRDNYVTGGGDLGYTSPVPTSLDAFNKTYATDRMSGDSLAAYNYLAGKGEATYPTKSGFAGQLSQDYATSVLGYPARGNLPYIYNKATGKMDPNPDYVAPGRSAAGDVTYSMSLNDIKNSLKETPMSGQALYDWAMSNNLSAQQIADATGRSLSSVYADFRAGSKAKTDADKKKTDDDAAAAAANTQLDSSSTGGEAAGGLQRSYAMGGYAVGGGLGTLGGYSDGGRLLKGPGDGVSDSIPATIGRKQQPARLADGEFVVPARIVSELGNGSTDAGAKKLYAMMDRVQRARGKTTGKNKVAANSRADKYLPA